MAEIREIEMAEVRKHNSEESTWIVIRGEVYDVTKFLKEHPGGADQLLGVAGKDATKDFNNVGHSSDARNMLAQFKIGVLSSKDNLETSNSSPSKDKEASKSCCILQ
ncbi:cytochrome b5-like [Neocloeon triangulifer]|uniref:cytochrome b5-like n=1 Tax=Neocloeon triangulifer TaxID=2078957 RepID=UPI00286F37B5|nr:cytochrome b5-like [Neocloeon triangulifer]